MSPVTALVTVFILSGVTTTNAQTRMEQLAVGLPYFASDTLHTRNETREMCAKWSMRDEVNDAQMSRLLLLCYGNPVISASFRTLYWLIEPDANATHISAINFNITCQLARNYLAGNIMRRVICVISRDTFYNGAVPLPEEPPPYGGNTAPPPVGLPTEMPSCGSILLQIPMKTLFLYMTLVLVILLLKS